MKASLKDLAGHVKAEAQPALAAVPVAIPSYPVAKTRLDSRQLSGHYPAEHVQAFRVLAAANDKDVQELLAEAVNMVFERYGLPNRITVTSGKRRAKRVW
jgi:hypothetical protein